MVTRGSMWTRGVCRRVMGRPTARQDDGAVRARQNGAVALHKRSKERCKPRQQRALVDLVWREEHSPCHGHGRASFALSLASAALSFSILACNTTQEQSNMSRQPKRGRGFECGRVCAGESCRCSESHAPPGAILSPLPGHPTVHVSGPWHTCASSFFICPADLPPSLPARYSARFESKSALTLGSLPGCHTRVTRVAHQIVCSTATNGAKDAFLFCEAGHYACMCCLG